MTQRFTRIGLTVKQTLDFKDDAVERVLNVLRGMDLQVVADRERMQDVKCLADVPVLRSPSDIDVLLVIGGDGTIMRAMRELGEHTLPILGINRGQVGFLSEIDLNETEEWLPKLLNGEGILEERRMLRVTASRDGKEFFQGHALNEAVIAQGAIARLIDLRTVVNDELLTTFHADGLIAATPTGSTAYSLAAGGPVVHPALSALILTPINPHSFSQKPIVIPGESTVSVEVMARTHQPDHAEVSLTLDGQVYQQLRRGDKVMMYLNERSARFLRRKTDTFYATLRSKLKWGEHVEAAPSGIQ